MILNVHWQGTDQDKLLVGQLGYERGQSVFEYSPIALANGLNLSPLKLKFEPGLQVAPRSPFVGLHGAFADSLPDGWGLALMDRHFQRKGIDLASITPLARLSYLGHRAMGALSYEPAQAEDPTDETLNLDELSREANHFYDGKASELLPLLLKLGGSPAGARPKVLVGVCGDKLRAGASDLPSGYEHWLIKFTPQQSIYGHEESLIEFAYAEMARQAGIKIPTTRLFHTADHRRFFGIKRFDRQAGNGRLHMHTLAGLLHADFRVPDTDYSQFLRATRYLTRSHPETVEAFKRMLFNILAGNRDDHSKNFAFLWTPTNGWQLAPAYDLLFNSGINGEHTMSVAGKGKNINRTDLIKLGQLMSISEKDVEQLIDITETGISYWERLSTELGISSETRSEIARHINAVHRELS
jgi:serine/threonine-protein kinase HipA